jgi:hypothetical protein
MQRLCRITVPGLSIESDFTAARECLLADFPNVHEVIATTAPATLLVLYSGCADADAWAERMPRVRRTPAPRFDTAELSVEDTPLAIVPAAPYRVP